MGLWSQEDLEDNNNFKPIPEGRYNATVENCTLEDVKHDNGLVTKTKIRMCYALPNSKRKLFQNFTFNDHSGTVKFLNWQLSTLGVDMGEVNLCTSFEDAAHMAANTLFKYVGSGVEVEVDVKHREYNGKIYENAVVHSVLANGSPSTTTNETVMAPTADLPNMAPTINANEKMPWE